MWEREIVFCLEEIIEDENAKSLTLNIKRSKWIGRQIDSKTNECFYNFWFSVLVH